MLIPLGLALTPALTHGVSLRDATARAHQDGTQRAPELSSRNFLSMACNFPSNNGIPQYMLNPNPAMSSRPEVAGLKAIAT
jgi:hypothetical protein